LHLDGQTIPLRTVRWLLAPVIAVEVLEGRCHRQIAGFFRQAMHGFWKTARACEEYLLYGRRTAGDHGHRLLAIPSRDRLERVLKYM